MENRSGYDSNENAHNNRMRQMEDRETAILCPSSADLEKLPPNLWRRHDNLCQAFGEGPEPDGAAFRRVLCFRGVAGVSSKSYMG